MTQLLFVTVKLCFIISFVTITKCKISFSLLDILRSYCKMKNFRFQRSTVLVMSESSRRNPCEQRLTLRATVAGSIRTMGNDSFSFSHFFWLRHSKSSISEYVERSVLTSSLLHILRGQKYCLYYTYNTLE